MAACASIQTKAAEVQSGRWLNGERQKNTASTAILKVYRSRWQSDPRKESTVMISAGELRIKIARLSCHKLLVEDHMEHVKSGSVCHVRLSKSFRALKISASCPRSIVLDIVITFSP